VILVMAAVFAVHVTISRLISLPAAAGRYELLVGVAYFVFGLFAAFAVESARGSLLRVNELLKAGDADLVSIYQLSVVFGPAVRSELRSVIDSHLQDQIDYRLVDFDQSTESFETLFEQICSLKPDDSAQGVAYDHLIGVCVQAEERRRRLIAIVRERVTAIEWVVLLSLFVSLWGLMFAANGGPVLASILGGILVASLAGMLVMLHHLDSFRWQEGDSIWQPLHSLFITLDLVPYYPGFAIDTGRLDPPAGRIRVAEYPMPYPDMAGKTVREIDHLGGHR